MEDWRELRFADRSSSDYRRAIAGIAQRLANANRQIIRDDMATAASGALLPSTASPESSAPDDEPGLIDILAIGQSAFPEANQTILNLGAEFVKLNEYVDKAASDIARSDEAGEGPIGRLAVARELAQNITQPAERIFALANKYSAQMYDIDPSVRTLISMAPEAIKEEGGRDAVCTFFDGVNIMARSAREMVTQLDGFREVLTQSEALSRDLRPPLRKTRQGLTIIVEASSVTDEWAKAIAESPIDCSAPTVQ